MKHTEDDLRRDEARAAAHKRPQIETPIEGVGAAGYPEMDAAALRAELEHLRRKRKFIAHGEFLPMTNENYRIASNMSHSRVVRLALDGPMPKMQLLCGDWVPIPPNNPANLGDLRFCGRCADAAYRVLMLNEIAEDENRTRTALEALIPWWRRWLSVLLPVLLLAALAVAAIHTVAATPAHQIGNFDPRSDDNADGQCP